MLYLVTYSTKKKELPEMENSETKDYLLSTLLTGNRSSLHYGLHGGSMRRFITGVREYEPLCTTEVPFGIDGEWYHSIGYIISPVTIPQWKSNKHLEPDAFVDSVCAGDEFRNLVNHVYSHQVEEKKYSEEEIISCYKGFLKEIYTINKKK